MIDFKTIAADAIPQLRQICATILPGGTIRGAEYVSKNPTRSDKSAGSFSVNLSTGIWHDFATNDGGHDAISLVAYVRGCRQGDAARELADMIGSSRLTEPQPAQHHDAREWELIIPVPADADPVPTERPLRVNGDWVRYTITHYWPYHDRLGNLLQYVIRYETPTGKETPPLTYWRNVKTGKFKWRCGALPAPRPLYNLPKLVHASEPRVIVVEGEKCAETLQAILGQLSQQIIVCTWPGGAKAIGKIDFEPLNLATQILFWPDNTVESDPGYETMLRIAGIVAHYRRSIPMKIIRRQADRPEGWDCADAILQDGWDAQRCLEFIKTQAESLPDVLPEIHQATTVQQDDQLPSAPPSAAVPIPFRVLGYDADNCYFYPDRTCMVTRVAASNLTKKAYLYTIAPAYYWESEFRGSKGPNWDMAAQSLHHMVSQAGPFSLSKIRGRGVWIDDGRNVVNLGRGLLVNGEHVSLQKIKSESIYQAGSALEHAPAKPLPDGAGEQLHEICRELFWESDIYGTMLAGWLVIAPICGGLQTRPHVWLTGPSAAGKTSVVEMIIKPCLGELALNTQSNTSEAGIRQWLGHDALPVIIDEFESEDADDLKRVEKILILARQAFSGESPIIKGGQSGVAQSYLVRSCFFMSSINVSISQRADKTRIMVLRMVEPHTRYDLSPKQQWESLKSRIQKTLTPEWCASLRARSISLLPVINQNSRIFADVIAEHLSSSRTGDQIGPVLAGVYSLKSSAVISCETAVEIVNSMRWSDQVETNDMSERDEMQCLRTILGTAIRFGRGEICLSEIVETMRDADGDSGDDYRQMMAIYGCKISIDRSTLYIAKDQTQIQRILDRTPWKTSYFELLKRIADHPKTSQQKINGIRRLCVNIPMSKIFD